MSGGGAANNSWTILTSEETVAETLRPFADGTKQHEESHTSAAGSGEKNQPGNNAESTAEGLPEEGSRVSEEKTADQSEDPNSDPPSVDACGTLGHGNEESRTEGLTQSCPELGSSSDSYTLLTPSLDGPPVSLLGTETLGGAEFSQAEEQLPQEETLHLQSKEKPYQEGKQSGISEESTAKGETEERRRKSILEQIGRKREEEEEVEEEFQVPQQEDDGVFSLNKCILAALILLGLGTIFFSGVFMDFDEEGDYATRELKDTVASRKPEWPSTGVPPGFDPNSSELLNKLAEGNQQISALQAQLQAKKEELKVAKEQAAEGAKERLLWEEVEKENRRLKTEIASLPALQKENDRMRKELESIPTLQKELETLRSTVTNRKPSSEASQTDQASTKHSTLPPSGQTEDGRQDTAASIGWKTWEGQRKDLKRDKYEMKKEKEKYSRNDRDERDLKKGDKMEKKEKQENGKREKKEVKLGKKEKQRDETKEWTLGESKKAKGARGEYGRTWKEKEGRKERKKEGDWEKRIFEKEHEGKRRTGKKEKEEWRGGKHHEHKPRGEMEWKKGKHGAKEKQQRKDWKDKGDESDPKGKDNIGKNHHKERKVKGEGKQWDSSKSQDKERTEKDERKQWNEYEQKSKNAKKEKKLKEKDETSEKFKIKEMKQKKHNADLEKDQSHSLNKRNEHKIPGDLGHKEEHLYVDRKPHHNHPKPSIGQPEYWLWQRERLQHDPNPPQQCDVLETCAQAEGLLPVPLSEFQSVLEAYLTKAEEAGVDGSKTSELRKLTLEFFKDGTFVHNQRSFQDFVDDLANILEDLVEGEDGVEEDSDLEDEMEAFEKEVLKRFSLPGGGEKEKRIKGEWRKENREERG